MTLVVLSPPEERPREPATVTGLFAAGLDRYHLRKPGWAQKQIAHWLSALPAHWRGRVVLHSHHGLAVAFELWGVHLPDRKHAGADEREDLPRGCRISRSCHDVATVKAALGCCDSLFFGPVFPSLSKPGYGPVPTSALNELQALLATRPVAKRGTQVLALGGVTAAGLERCAAKGFDGVAVLGAIWAAEDPVSTFLEFQRVRSRLSAGTSSNQESMP